jgi:hypothetical protein
MSRTIVIISGVLALLGGPHNGAHAGKFSGLGRALAAGIGKGGSATATTARRPDLTRDQLRKCIALEEGINRSADALSRQKKALDEEAAALSSLLADIKARRARLDRASATAVDGFNATLDGVRRRGKAHDRRITEFNASVADHRRDVASFDTGCVGKSYLESDMRAIKDEAGRRG